MSDSPPCTTTFRDLNLPAPLMAALDDVGYETPTPIQAQAIPPLLEGRDVLGRAPTGTGKTAAFAMPLLSRLDISDKRVQVMVLTPTRELAIQVAEAFQKYASHIRGFHVIPIYGGQAYGGQIKQLRRGVHVVVGTPGRIMDHMRKGTLKLDALQALVLDEADEMLRMGFIDDVEWILEQIPEKRQMALFSATMPKEIKKIAQRYLRDAQEVSIKTRTATADTIRQRFWPVSHHRKLDALTRILEVEPFEAILMFVRTKSATTDLAERLEARGYATAALNGDMAQSSREQMIARLKKGSLDILVATDVAARGLDVERISHVINYDIPHGTEAYIHRIGRTGRAGRQGEAILFVTPRERGMLRAIEKATRHKIEQLELPTTEMVNNKRIADFKQKISDTIAGSDLGFMRSLLEQFRQEHDVPALDIAAALATISMEDRPLLLKEQKGNYDRQDSAGRRDSARSRDFDSKRGSAGRRKNDTRDSAGRPDFDRRDSAARRSEGAGGSSRRPDRVKLHNQNVRPQKGLERFRIEVGHDHDVKPGNIVGAIANESGLSAQHIGHIEIQTDFTLIDLPKGMPDEIFQDLRKVWVCGQKLQISRLENPRKKKKSPRLTDKNKGKRRKRKQ